MEEDVEAMEQELTGKMSAHPVEIADLPIQRKHPVFSSPLDTPYAQLSHPAKPSYFKEKSLKEAADYEVSWKIHLEAISPIT
jgi:hypothetical protein